MTTKYVWPLVASALMTLAGVALIIWPYTAHANIGGWTRGMTTDFWSGIGIAVIGLMGLAAWMRGLKGELTTKGFLAKRQPTSVATSQPLADDDLNRLLRPLAETVLRDLTAKLEAKQSRSDGGGTGA